ncbi:protein of unknown function DUF955 [Desulforamulus reducens MI-1]|uniref:IrrE N-terminal-like domain-containing protein n=1 Tax=Desulforamulus reducens (strain ATCC BAA-1160 / DSM 100696 / MI-1) TaxID=349161 RepID=A4J2W4_DESRM|nr:ImmA/IrrE family metallo-endopeptidase [Desulforamulus reducens]ABO49417.1 protein of unknown function DUF955 [Desulforamulus reducens MI-1]
MGYIKNDNGEAFILLNAKLRTDPVLYLCTMAEEIGHHITKAKSNILAKDYSLITITLAKSLNMAIDELKARIWAVNFLIPDEEFKKLTKYKLTNSELASYFKVTEEFIEIKWQLL